MEEDDKRGEWEEWYEEYLESTCSTTTSCFFSVGGGADKFGA